MLDFPIHNRFLSLISVNKGFGHMILQPQHLEMQPSIVGQRSCRLNGSVNLIVWYVISIFLGFIFGLCRSDSLVISDKKFMFVSAINLLEASYRHC